ncbi:Mediator of RNA polymerase II transcription subunit 19 [Portunus trituberculatus]|uniref:Mediator of RNA polymerase II transcription subunit 19 n=1 Tax=Portunus trituberculatus TaxID=210409 RepID=A0A5B7GTV0_PORTR|nr:Mediator of RNA polymerase II transcription subunit 19 [Portunus trituberculatus]
MFPAIQPTAQTKQLDLKHHGTPQLTHTTQYPPNKLNWCHPTWCTYSQHNLGSPKEGQINLNNELNHYPTPISDHVFGTLCFSSSHFFLSGENNPYDPATENELTGANNLMAHFNLEHSYNKFTGKKNYYYA